MSLYQYQYQYQFTVFTPTFNRANTLGLVFESLMKQSYKNFEWLIVDDGSHYQFRNRYK